MEIPVPDVSARQKLLQILLCSKPIAFNLEEACGYLAERGEGLSGRDLRNWIEQAEQNALGRAIEAGNPDLATITMDDFPMVQPA